MPKLPVSLAFSLCIFAPQLLPAADAKLDQILAELEALRGQVASLEQRLQAVESAPPPVAVHAPETEEQGKWYDAMRIELKKADARASGPWVEPSSWSRIEEGMKKEQVIEILGEPSRLKFSVRKDTDEILIYEGDFEGDGELVEGEVRLYKGKVRRFTEPDFPSP